MQPKIQILGLFPDLLANGGVQEAGRQTAAALSAIAESRGWVSRYLALNDPRGPQSLIIRERSIPFSGFHRGKIQFVFEAIREARNNTRIVLAGHPNLALPAALAKRFAKNARTIVVTHGVEVWVPLPPQRRNALLAADLILAPSSYTAQKLVEVQSVPASKIRCLPWPLDPAFLKLAASLSTLPLPPNLPAGPVILAVGRWAASEKYKGADDLIRAVAALRREHPSLSLVLVGTGDDLPRLKRIAGDEFLGDAVVFLENLSRPELAACYAQADIFALPSSGEGFGLVFLEAMAFAKPVVCVAIGGPVDLIRNGDNGLLVPPKQPAALVQALDNLLRDAALREKMGGAGAAIAATEYSVPAFQQRLEDIVASVIG
jgi:phosphatidyl-myo-inositol dimannoside synthase